jgi:capsid protein
MLHGFNPEYAGQGRGMSPMTHLLHELEKITDFKVATLQKAIEQASLVMAVENEKVDSSNPFEGRTAGPYSYGAPSEETTVSTGNDTDPVINYTAMPEATHTQPGVGVFNLRAGDKLQFLKDTSPSAQFDAFCNSVYTNIAASVGWSIEMVQKKFGNSFSASRATLLLCHRTAIIERDEQNADLNNPVYEMWLSEEIAAGRISAPGFSDPLLKMAWLCAEWSGSPMINIDPQKSANADLLYASLGAQTLDDVARNFNGSSGKANRSKLQRQWNELPVPTLPIMPINTTPPQEQEEDNG